MSKKILSINSGSSSLKFKLYQMPEEEVLASGQVDRIGIANSTFDYTVHGKATQNRVPMKSMLYRTNTMRSMVFVVTVFMVLLMNTCLNEPRNYLVKNGLVR